MKTVEEHVAECLAAVEVPAPIGVSLLEAVDCVLAEQVHSAVNLPPFDNSAMDGYAVRVPDVAAASPQRPASLPVSADIPAGPTEPMRLAPGSVARIMTGAPVPAGSDAVVPVEWTDGGIGQVGIRQAPKLGQYIRLIGEDVRAGEEVLAAGTRLTPRHIALLAAIGRRQVVVHPRPRVVVLSTGSELVGPGGSAGYGQIHDANGIGLTVAARELGVHADYAGIVGDDPGQLMAMLEKILPAADLVITSGGVSAGAYDTVKEVLSTLGTVTFERVAMQPGMPQGFGWLTTTEAGGSGGSGGEIPIFTLPGNPVSAMVSFEVFVRPVIRKLAGELSLHRHLVPARAATGWRSPAGKRQFVRAVLTRTGLHSASVQPVGGQGSHLVADLALANCLAVVPEDVSQVEPGDVVQCMLLDRIRR